MPGLRWDLTDGRNGSTGPPATRRDTWADLTCLLCGEQAGRLEQGRIVRPSTPGSIRWSGQRLACGRCGGALLREERVHDLTPAHPRLSF